MSTRPLRIALAGREHVVDAGTTAGARTGGGRAGGADPGAHAVIAARVDGELRDLNREVADGDVIEPVRIDDPDGRAILRHSTTHELTIYDNLSPDTGEVVRKDLCRGLHIPTTRHIPAFQVVGIPIADAHAPYLDKVVDLLGEQGIRAEVDTSDDRMQKKIRTARRR